MKWCATPTPFRGLRVFLRSAQGMPGSSETLEELMSTILGHYIQEGKVANIAVVFCTSCTRMVFI